MDRVKRVHSISELKELTSEHEREFKVLLNYGCFSRKTVKYNPKTKKFRVHNHIDNTKEFLTETELINDIIGQAIAANGMIIVP